MAGWLHGVFVVDWLFVFPLCGFSLSLFCNYLGSPRLTAAGPARAPRGAVEKSHTLPVNATTSQIGVVGRTGRWWCACANVWTCGRFGVDVRQGRAPCVQFVCMHVCMITYK